MGARWAAGWGPGTAWAPRSLCTWDHWSPQSEPESAEPTSGNRDVQNIKKIKIWFLNPRLLRGSVPGPHERTHPEREPTGCWRWSLGADRTRFLRRIDADSRGPGSDPSLKPRHEPTSACETRRKRSRDEGLTMSRTSSSSSWTNSSFFLCVYRFICYCRKYSSSGFSANLKTTNAEQGKHVEELQILFLFCRKELKNFH